MAERRGPLKGIRVIEIAGAGPGPFTAMMLADMGADVLRIDRTSGSLPLGAGTVLDRGRRSAGIDLKNPAGAETLLRLVERADALIEGFRPGVAERLGIGPDVCLARNRRLVYGRMTGWGQDGPLAKAAGHDINYISLAGVLGGIGPKDGPPSVPLNLIGDFGGGGLLLAFGIVAALVERATSGRGQVVDAAMVDGAALLANVIHAYADSGWIEERQSNMLDGGAHFYNVYECSDGRYVSVGAIEPQFYAALIAALGLADENLPEQMDMSAWPDMRVRFAEIFRTRTRDEWCEALEGGDALVSPVLTWSESKHHPHNVARGTFVESGGLLQPGPAPRFDRTPGAISRPAPAAGEHTSEALADWGFEAGEIAKLREEGAIK
jgi:alpha-methylacyl-CoA racemase